MNQKLIMTPGPTSIADNVLFALGENSINPDLDKQFFIDYEKLLKKLANFLNTSSDVLILGGEGILGLEASCASLIEPEDRVLCLSNGPFGKGFASFVSMYGGVPVLFESDFHKPLSVKEIESFLDEQGGFKAATIIHCETPTGVLNPIEDICPLLAERGIVTIVDAVSSIGAHDIDCDNWHIDMLLGASQKCFSAPAGLTFLTVSDRCWQIMDERTTPIASFYANLKLFKEWKAKQWFPYTMPSHLIHSFSVAVDNVMKEQDGQDEDRQDEEGRQYGQDNQYCVGVSDIFTRHSAVASYTRQALTSAGLKLYSEGGFSDSVTAFFLPSPLKSIDFLEYMKGEFNIFLGGGLGLGVGEEVIRIGHMGENCREELVRHVLSAIEKALL